jgi:ribonuclease PH
MSRHDNRQAHEIRPVTLEKGIAPHAQGSVLVSFGNTKVICAATIEESVPRWMKEQNKTGGWITAEYSMLPYSTLTRKQRDSSRGRVDGRGTEIQRLIGRSLRAVVDLEKLGQRTLWVDCDVLQADGGTRGPGGSCAASARARLRKQSWWEAPERRPAAVFLPQAAGGWRPAGGTTPSRRVRIMILTART